jgi:hypothetical protein
MSAKEVVFPIFSKALKAAVLMTANLLVAALMILFIHGLELLSNFLLGSSDALLFNRFPVRWLFDFMNFSILIVFVFTGFGEAFRLLFGR